VVVLVFIFTLLQMFVLQRACNQGMKVAESLEYQGLPNLDDLAVLQEQLVLFRLYSYQYMFVSESERPGLAAATQGARKQVQRELSEIKKLLRDPQGQRSSSALETSFATLSQDFDRAQRLVDKDFAGAMNIMDNDIPPEIQSVDDAAEKLNSFGYHFSGVQANAAFDSFNGIKNKTFFYGTLNIVVALGLVVFVLLAARRTRRQLAGALEQLNVQTGELRLQTSALEAAASGMAITNRDGRVLWVNPAFTELTGYEPAEVIGQTSAILKSGHHGPEFYANMWQTVLAGNVWHGELVTKRKDGSCYDEEMTITPVHGADGEIQNFIAIKQNVSERKKIERVLARERDLLQALMDNLPDYIYFKDANSRFTRINQAHARHLGLKQPEEAIGKSDAEFFPMREARQKLVDERRLLATGEPILGMVEKVGLSGGTQWVSSTKVAIHGENGEITGLVGISHDITGSKRAEEELRWKTAFLEAQVNSSIDGVLVVNEQGIKILQNQRMTDLFKIPQRLADDTVATTQRQWIADMTTKPEPFLRKVLYLYTQPNEISRDEVELKDGTILDLYSSPVIDKDGKYYGRIWTFRDITERKRAEEVRQTMELQLRQSQKLESVGQLAAGIAHEINTPTQYVGDNTRFVKDSFTAILKVLKSHEELLAAARQNTITPELLARQEAVLAASDLDYLYTQIPSALAETLEGVERVSKIVRAMKEFSHPGGKEKTAADLNRAIESTITVAHNEWKYVADLKVELDPGLPLVPCFLGEFNQCILNLVVNAAHAIGDVVKAQPGAKGLITVKTRRDGDLVEVCVTDTGTGIPEAIRLKIFDPFFTTKEVGKGTGQGLAMIYGSIVKRHGGAVTFESKVGQGTTFIIRLPLKPKDNPGVNSPNFLLI
jgi:PAS domain S-box-containing protein